ncbi:Mitochondrial GTPase [Perkinsus olseni]|uniref:Mitochondrial GTPase n=2 Tax=Perkinsus olseni TaxID=32597 RepID=A0A7J6P409_PEROL|nr:Mitochondrial GTPase [Perkinsus olseni]
MVRYHRLSSSVGGGGSVTAGVAGVGSSSSSISSSAVSSRGQQQQRGLDHHQHEDPLPTTTDTRLLAWEAAFALDFGHNWENAYLSTATVQGHHHDTSSSIQDESIMSNNFQAFSALVRSSIPNNNHLYTDGYNTNHYDNHHTTTTTAVQMKRTRSESSSSQSAKRRATNGVATTINNNNNNDTQSIHHDPCITAAAAGPVLHVTGGMFLPILHQPTVNSTAHRRSSSSSTRIRSTLDTIMGQSNRGRTADAAVDYDDDDDDVIEFVIGRSTKDLITAAGSPSSVDDKGSSRSTHHQLPSLNLANLPGSQAVSRRHAVIRRVANDKLHTLPPGPRSQQYHHQQHSSRRHKGVQQDAYSSDWILINNSLNGTEVDSKILRSYTTGSDIENMSDSRHHHHHVDEATFMVEANEQHHHLHRESSLIISKLSASEKLLEKLAQFDSKVKRFKHGGHDGDDDGQESGRLNERPSDGVDDHDSTEEIADSTVGLLPVGAVPPSGDQILKHLHLPGCVIDMVALEAILNARNIRVVEDLGYTDIKHLYTALLDEVGIRTTRVDDDVGAALLDLRKLFKVNDANGGNTLDKTDDDIRSRFTTDENLVANTQGLYSINDDERLIRGLAGEDIMTYLQRGKEVNNHALIEGIIKLLMLDSDTAVTLSALSALEGLSKEHEDAVSQGVAAYLSRPAMTSRDATSDELRAVLANLMKVHLKAVLEGCYKSTDARRNAAKEEEDYKVDTVSTCHRSSQSYHNAL